MDPVQIVLKVGGQAPPDIKMGSLGPCPPPAPPSMYRWKSLCFSIPRRGQV